MKIGIDFDNTIVDYNRLFYEAACEKQLLHGEVSPDKNSIRNHLRSRNLEEEWTYLQGYVYGAKMLDADIFPGVINFFYKAKAFGIHCDIISHKTKYPFRGPQYDLHKVSRSFIEKNNFGVDDKNIYFETTKEDKIARIKSCRCTHFIDDLPEILTHKNFPNTVKRILFDPSETSTKEHRCACMKSWDNISAYFFGSLKGEVVSSL